MTRLRGLGLAALVTLILAACGSSDGGGATPSPERGTPPTVVSPSPVSTGATGATGATEQPAERSGFKGKIDPLPAGLAAEMRGTTWKQGCPVPLDDLRILHFNYWGFDHALRRGPMVVNASVADDVLWVFRQLYDAGFPIKKVALATEFKPERFAQHRRITSHRSVTASFNCRPVVTALGPGSDYSQHAYGLAIDLNPLQNPYVTTSGFVRNRAAEPYLDRGRHLEGMVHEGDVVFRSFAAIGWEWGGDWSGDKDYMHFSLLGR
ncbi:MAG TPA: M15 family metallopeptidase [Actinomycetota bacterium]|nr:M15 family metallopeptidase [Actinomycetota bacterium]